RIDVARQYTRGVGKRLAAPELHLVGGEQDHIAAELAHRHLERDPRARRGPLENHRQSLAGERPGFARALRFHGSRRLDNAAQIRGRHVDQVEEMADAHRTFSPAGALAWPPLSRAQARSSRATPSASSCSLTMSGGSSRTTLSPAATVSIFSARKASTSSPAGTSARRPISKPSPRTSAISDG